MSPSYPQQVGIKAIEIYVPRQTLDQAQYEAHQGVTAGKYTIGLGLTSMNYCTDREGRLEVGTESPIDKAKSVKSVLTQLFPGNTSLEGVDTVNACYGGTSALFNAINWVESRSWDGRDAVVVASDIAIYRDPSARPTGGAGAVAILVGPNAPIVAVPGLRGTYMTHAFDFYKPDFKSEYPLVDGHHSISCYLSALDGCYGELRKATAKLASDKTRYPEATAVLARPRDSLVDVFDYMAFHTPNCKLVSKSYGRLLYDDFVADQSNAMFSSIPNELRSFSPKESIASKPLETAFVKLSRARYDSRVAASIAAPTRCGNMYTASVFCSLISLLCSIGSETLQGKTIGLFSYGSGIASSLYTMQVVGDITPMIEKLDIFARLDKRHLASPAEYDEARTFREAAYGAKDYTPSGDLAGIAEGAYYLEHIDEKYRRTYAIKKGASIGGTNGVNGVNGVH
ncbi:hypothetical protein ANO11243_026520 [Dothideomycetidae sp. 11243]|nr:hypothetical protein ANO11243_026520 [fungal sp. No.11243]